MKRKGLKTKHVSYAGSNGSAKKNRRRKMQFVNGSKVRILETAISEANVKAQVETFLRATKTIRNHEDVVGFEMGPLKDGIYPITIRFREEAVNQLIEHGKS